MRNRFLGLTAFAVFALQLTYAATSQEQPESNQNRNVIPADVAVEVNKSTILENVTGVKRISVANSDVAEAVAVSRTEVLVNGIAPGTTSLVLWDLKNQRSMFDVLVGVHETKPDTIVAELQRELPGQDVSFSMSDGIVFLRGVV